MLIDLYDYPLHPLTWDQDDIDVLLLCAVRHLYFRMPEDYLVALQPSPKSYIKLNYI